MQKPMPTNATGVPVTIYISDEAGSVVFSETVTSDVSGQYALSWAPTTEGLYTVNAVFDGTKGYFASDAETHISVQIAQATSTPPPTPTPTSTPTAVPTLTASPTATVTAGPEPGNDYTTITYVGIAAVAVIVVIIAAAMILRKRK